jgi:hypothetical protein
MKHPFVEKSLLLAAAMTFVLALGACRSVKNGSSGYSCQECSECEKPAAAMAKQPSAK